MDCELIHDMAILYVVSISHLIRDFNLINQSCLNTKITQQPALFIYQTSSKWRKEEYTPPKTIKHHKPSLKKFNPVRNTFLNLLLSDNQLDELGHFVRLSISFFYCNIACFVFIFVYSDFFFHELLLHVLYPFYWWISRLLCLFTYSRILFFYI